MLAFMISSLAGVALLMKLVLLDLTLLKRSFMDSLQGIDTAMIPGQIELLLGYRLDELLEKGGLSQS